MNKRQLVWAEKWQNKIDVIRHDIYALRDVSNDVEKVTFTMTKKGGFSKKCFDVSLKSPVSVSAILKELEKENAELKAEWQEQVQKTTDEGYARTLQTIQLTKAKEILKAVVDFYPTTTATILCEAEKFISEVEK